MTKNFTQGDSTLLKQSYVRAVLRVGKRKVTN